MQLIQLMEHSEHIPHEGSLSGSQLQNAESLFLFGLGEIEIGWSNFLEEIDAPYADHLAKHLGNLGGCDEISLFVEHVSLHVVSMRIVGETLFHVIIEGHGSIFLF